MIYWINNFSSIGHIESDSNEQSIQKNFLVFLATFMSCGGILWGSISLYFGLIIQSIVPFAYILLSIINMFYFHRTKDFRTVSFFQILISLALPFIFQMALGGFFPSGNILLWSILALVASLSFNDIKSSLFWLILFLTCTILSAYFDGYVLANKPVILSDQSLVFTVLNITVITTILFGLVLYFIELNKLDRAELAKATKRMKKLNLELEKNLIDKNEALEELTKAQRHLIQSEKMASIGVLSAGVAHEINNPLNHIKGGIDGISRLIETTDDDTNTYIKIVNDGVKRASDIVRSLSHFSHSNVDTNQKCDVHEILENCLLILSGKLKYKAEIIKNLTTDSAVVTGNEGRLHQAILNILSNAEQAISGIGEITISTEVINDELNLSISDSGHGIEKKHLLKIMDPFFTTKDPGLGTGLGLSITHKIIQEHKGRIEVESLDKKGAKFQIFIPISRSLDLA